MKGFGKSPTKDGTTTTTTTGRPSGRLWSSVRTKLSIIPKKRSTSPTSKIPSRSASLRTARNKLGVTEVVHSIQSAPHSPVIAGEPTTDPAVDALAPITAEEKPQNPPTLLEVYQELVQKNEERRNSEEAAAAATPPEKVSKESAMALRAYVQSLEEKYKDQPHKLDIDGREIIWRDYVNKVERLLVIVGHVAGTFTTSPNPTVWSAINVLIKTDVTQCEDFAAILGCVEKALDILRRGSTYEEVYLQQGADTRAAGDLKSGVTALYETVAELLTRARGRLDEGQGKQLLRTLIDGDDSYEVLKRVQNKERDLDRAVQACDAELTTQQRAILKKLEEPVRRVDSSVEYSLEVVDSRECRKTLEYISNIEIGRHHAENSQKRTKGTCEWLLKKPEYVQWQGSSWSSILWLKGHAGAGKSLLVSRVVDQFVEELVDKLAPQDDEHKREMHHEGFAYFYCHRSISDGRNTKKILHSLIRQLASTRGNSGKIHKELRLRFKKARLEKKGFSEQECWHILKKFVNTYPRTTLVLDALNECKKQDRRMLIEGLHSLVNESERPVKVLIASRPEVDIRDNLFHPDLVEVEAAGNTDDIATYIEDEIGKHRQNGMWRTVSPELQQDVVRTVRSKSNGIFRWAYLQWEELKRVEDASEVQSRLAKLPKGLSNTYDEMCNALGSDNLGILERAIKWVYCAPIPLSSEILLAAIRMDHSSTDERVHLTQRYPVKESDFERICHNFIIKDSASKWKFAHASVIDYFEETRKDFSIKAPKDVASILLQALIDCYSKVELPQANNALETLLEKEQEVEGEDNCLFVNHPFMKWAESTWVDYVHQTSTESTRVPKLLQTFLGLGDSAGPGSPYQIWCRVYCMRPSRRSYTSQDFEPWGNVAFGICTFGLDQHIGTEWEKLIPTSGVNYSGLNLLEVAAKNKRFALCRKLLKLDEGLVKSPGFALEISLEHSDARTLKALLAGGVDPNMLMRGCRGLCYAASGELSLTEELLNAGANPQLPCSDTCTTRYPLIRASWCGNYETVDLLVKKGGADVNLRLKAGEAGVYGNALVAAVAAGELDTAKMLVSQHGARPNGHIEYGHYRSVLAAAVLGDCHSFVVVDRPRTFEQMMRWLVAEAGLDMSPQSLTPPLGKPSQGALFTAVRGKGDELTRRARYLMSQYGVEAEVVGRIGFDENVRFQSARKHGDRHLSC